MRHIAVFWAQANPLLISAVMEAINTRIEWLASDNHLLGTPIKDLGPEYRSIVERRFGYRIYYRLEGQPVDTLAILAVRHGRQRPLRSSSLRQFARS